MQNDEPDLMPWQYMRGLSGGISILAIAGIFWFDLAAWSADCVRAGILPWAGGRVPLHYLFWAPWMALAIGGALFFGGIGVRRRARLLKQSLKVKPSERQQRRRRAILRQFFLIDAADIALCGVSAYLGLHFQRQEFLWPAIGLIVSAHFVPLGRLFRVPPYAAGGAVGALVSLAALLAPASLLPAPYRWLVTGAGMGAMMWITAGYLILRADRLEATSVRTLSCAASSSV